MQKKNCYEVFYETGEWEYFNINLGLQLLEMLEINKYSVIAFYRVSDSFFDIKKIVDLENCEFYFDNKRKDSKYHLKRIVVQKNWMKMERLH